MQNIKHLIKTKDKIVSEVVCITPQYAVELLERNDSNRPLSEATVRRYAGIMSKGLWKLNGEPIIISKTGRLLSGQHRLQAVIKSGVSVYMLVVSGVEDETFTSLDQGKIRSAADVLGIHGEFHTNVLSAALALLYRYKQSPKTFRGDTSGPQARPDNQEMIKLVQQNPDIRHSVENITGPYRNIKKIMPPSVATFCHYILSQIDQDTADLMFDYLASGLGTKEGDPIYVLRERLLTSRNSRSSLGRREIIALVFKAWNSVRADKKVRTLRWSESYESFPAPQ